MHRRVLSIICMLWLFACTLMAESPKPVTSIDLQDGDSFVFLGDSITHQCLYTQYVEDYFTHVIPSGEFTSTTPALAAIKRATRWHASEVTWPPRTPSTFLYCWG